MGCHINPWFLLCYDHFSRFCFLNIPGYNLENYNIFKKRSLIFLGRSLYEPPVVSSPLPPLRLLKSTPSWMAFNSKTHWVTVRRPLPGATGAVLIYPGAQKQVCFLCRLALFKRRTQAYQTETKLSITKIAHTTLQETLLGHRFSVLQIHWIYSQIVKQRWIKYKYGFGKVEWFFETIIICYWIMFIGQRDVTFPIRTLCEFKSVDEA